MMPRRHALLLAIAAGVALAMLIAHHSTPVFLDVVLSSIELIATAPFALIFVIVLLLVTAGAGAWALVVGMRAQVKRSRHGRHRRSGHRLHLG